MLSEQILKLFQQTNIDPKKFDHFDYAQAFQKLKQDYNIAVDLNPTKKKIIQKFIQKAYEQITKNDPIIRKKKVSNFMQRMQTNKRIQEQKLQAMRFISQNYDQKSGQLWFYPNSKRKRQTASIAKSGQTQVSLSASRNYRWDVDDVWQVENAEDVQAEKPIKEPNQSQEWIQESDQFIGNT